MNCLEFHLEFFCSKIKYKIFSDKFKKIQDEKMAKKAVITILGLIGHSTKKQEIKDNKIVDIFIDKKNEDKAKYTFSKKLIDKYHLPENKNYINMLTVLDAMTDDQIIAIGTKKAIDIQKKVIEYEKIDREIEYKEIEDEKEYDNILVLIDSIIDEYDEVVFDVSHGFRHLPILATVSLIIQNIKDPDKVRNIIFAKEIEAFKEYEIIDLKEYLDLAKLSYVLSSFNDNYTVGNSMTFSEESCQNLVDQLRIISTHILANSVQQLIGEENILTQTITSLKKLQKEEDTLRTFNKYITDITGHLSNIKNLQRKPHYYQLFSLATMMEKRGYLLNSITLFNESVGLYCVEELKSIDERVKKHIEEYQGINNNLYELAQQSKTIIKNKENFTGVYLFDTAQTKLTSGHKTSLQKKKKKLKERIPEKILEEIENSGFTISLSPFNKQKDKSITQLIQDYLQKHNVALLEELIISIEKLRNNLAHGNSSGKIENVQRELGVFIKKFKSLINETNKTRTI